MQIALEKKGYHFDFAIASNTVYTIFKKYTNCKKFCLILEYSLIVPLTVECNGKIEKAALKMEICYFLLAICL